MKVTMTAAPPLNESASQEDGETLRQIALSIPKIDVIPDELDSLIAQEMNQMSLKERELVYERIHGVETLVDETPDFLAECLLALDQELRKITSKAAYDSAEQISKDYVEDPKFRLMFLRAEYYKAKPAATRLVSYMEGKLKLFGQDALTRNLYLSDLGEDGKTCLKTGVMQMLPQRDTSGRAVMFDMHAILPNCGKTHVDLMKTFIYVMLSAAEDEETQRRGVVIIHYFMGLLSISLDPDKIKEAAALTHWIPLRIAGIHQCLNDPLLRAFASILLLGAGRERRAQVRLHGGSHQECQYSIMTFGVPTQFLPVTYEGGMKTANHMKWMAMHTAKDAEIKKTGTFEGVDLPTQKDVILGRGRRYQDNPGNVCMRSFVEAHFEEYKKSSKQRKRMIEMQVVELTNASGGRFLTQGSSGWWTEVSDEFARERVSNSFRNPRLNKTVPQKGTFDEILSAKRMKMQTEEDRTFFSACCGRS